MTDFNIVAIAILAVGMATFFAIGWYSRRWTKSTAEFAELAATMVIGLPLGFWLGIAMIIAGLIITRIYLAKVEG